MSDISFGSTYRIPLVQQGITAAKREALKSMASRYQNVLYPNGSNGNVRVSIRQRLDAGFELKLKRLGFKVFQKFERNNVPKTEFENSGVSKLDLYIKDELKRANYKQFGKQKKYHADFHKPEVNELSDIEKSLIAKGIKL